MGHGCLHLNSPAFFLFECDVMKWRNYPRSVENKKQRIVCEIRFHFVSTLTMLTTEQSARDWGAAAVCTKLYKLIAALSLSFCAIVVCCVPIMACAVCAVNREEEEEYNMKNWSTKCEKSSFLCVSVALLKYFKWLWFIQKQY